MTKFRDWLFAPVVMYLRAIAERQSRLEVKIVQLMKEQSPMGISTYEKYPRKMVIEPVEPTDWDAIEDLNAKAFADDKLRREAERLAEGETDAE